MLILVIILIILNSRTIAPWLHSSRWSGGTSSTCRWLDSFGSPSWRLSRSHEIVVLCRRRKSMAVLDALRLSVRLFHHFLFTSIAVLNTSFLLTFLRTRGSRKITWSNHMILLVTDSTSGSWYVSSWCTFRSDSQNSSILIHFWTVALENVVVLLFLGLWLVEKVDFRRIVNGYLRGSCLGSLDRVSEHLWSAFTPHETH